MAINIHPAALKELQRFPSPVLFRAKEAFAFLELGEKLSMPLSSIKAYAIDLARLPRDQD
ncbi:MAG: hypothetical protein NTY08_18885 [Proteobacteria bacterium]|nr:hypothetical protein [Pseudomonadota bacterium]